MKRKTTSAISILGVILICNLIPLVGGQYNIEYAKESNDFDIEVPSNNYISRIYMVGRISDLAIDEEYEFGNFTSFTMIRIFAIHIYRFSLVSRGFEIGHYRYIPIYFETGKFEFRGILRNNFVCGIFDLIIED